MTIINEFGSSNHKSIVKNWFNSLRDKICRVMEEIEKEVRGPNISSERVPGKFEQKSWLREKKESGGGGVMSILRGRVFEKAGVNVSTVQGEFSEEFKTHIHGAEKDPRFWASGISVVVHPLSPFVPAVHMNTRMIVTTQGWFGGGSDLTPVFNNHWETKSFHGAFKKMCDEYDGSYYGKFKKWCEEYFYLPHRDEQRGAGGIFFDNLNTGNWANDFKFVQDVGLTFLDIYPLIVMKSMNLAWDQDQKDEQLRKRGRYVEFNLLYDRGTLFGLKTGGNTEAILMSMPPEVIWP